jgi:hypothetical protein
MSEVKPWYLRHADYQERLAPFLPDYVHLLRHLAEAYDAVGAWCDAQRAAGLSGKVVVWKGSAPPRDIHSAPNIEDKDAVFRLFLERSACAKPLHETFVESFAKAFTDVSMGILTEDGAKERRISSGVVTAALACGFDLTADWEDMSWEDQDVSQKPLTRTWRHMYRLATRLDFPTYRQGAFASTG